MPLCVSNQEASEEIKSTTWGNGVALSLKHPDFCLQNGSNEGCGHGWGVGVLGGCLGLTAAWPQVHSCPGTGAGSSCGWDGGDGSIICTTHGSG